MGFVGAGEWTRTTDLLITNQLLYQLSYASLRSDGAREDERALYSSGRSYQLSYASLRSDGAREDERALYSSGRSPPILQRGCDL